MNCLDECRIVLVEPENPINVGTVIRAMKNMGFKHLYLVNPVEMDLMQTQISAHHSLDMLDSVVVVKSLDEALAGVKESYGFSARRRSQTWASLDMESAVVRALGIAQTGQNVAYVFGRERTGLTNEELNACSCRVHIETTEYSSLNLAQAVLLAVYSTSRLLKKTGDNPANPEILHGLDNYAPNTVPATYEEIHRLMQNISEMLVNIGFFKSEAPTSALRRIKNIVERAELHDDEVRLLLGICAEVSNYARLLARGIEPSKKRPKGCLDKMDDA